MDTKRLLKNVLKNGGISKGYKKIRLKPVKIN